MARKNVLTEIRESISPRKKKNDDSRKVKEYAVLRIPQSLFEDLQVLKLAYEIMWSEVSDLSSLSDEELETWEMEKMTQEEFFRRLYQAALRMDPALIGKMEYKGKKIDYLSQAGEAYRSRTEHDSRVKSAMEQAVRELVVRARRNGTEAAEEAISEQVNEKAEIKKNEKVLPEELNVILSFGKYKGKTVLEVYKEDPTYVTNFLPQVNAQTIVLSQEAIEFLKESSKA